MIILFQHYFKRFFRDNADFKFIKKVSRKESDELFRMLEIDCMILQPKVKKELSFR